MTYLAPSEFVTKMVDAGESKIFMSTRDTVIRAYMAGAILALAAWFAVTINVNTGQPLVGALLFPVGFSMLYLLGFDLLTGVFVLAPLALIDKRPGVTLGGVLRNWGLVFIGNFAGALTVAFMMAFVTTFGFTQDPDKVGMTIGNVGEARTLGYAAHGAAGMATLFLRGMLCNWMVSTGVVGAMISTSVPGKVIAMWMPILVFFYMVFEHSVVNMFLFPSGLMLHAKFSIMDYLVWNEIPTVLGNLVGGLAFTGLTLYTTHVMTAHKRGAKMVTPPRRAAACVCPWSRRATPNVGSNGMPGLLGRSSWIVSAQDYGLNAWSRGRRAQSGMSSHEASHECGPAAVRYRCPNLMAIVIAGAKRCSRGRGRI